KEKLISGKILNQDLLDKLNESETGITTEVTEQIKDLYNYSSDNILPPWDILFPEVKEGFDVIIGNPPWGVKVNYTPELLKGYKTAIKQFDSWVLFLEKSLKFLKKGGRLGFVLPNTLLTNENYSKARKIILESTTIIKIVNLGDGWFKGVSQPSMIIILEKGKNKNPSPVKVVDFIPNNDHSISLFTNDSFEYNTVKQSQFVRNTAYDFNIWEVGHEKIIQKIERENVRPLENFVTNARGVELNRKGRVIQCLECGWWNPPPKSEKTCCNPECSSIVRNTNPTHHIVSLEPREKSVPFLTGSHVNRYFLKPFYYIELGLAGVNYKDKSLYYGPKLLLRKTGHGIQTAIDYDNCWTSQVVYIFKLRDESPISLESIMGILNSKLMYYYYYRKHADPNTKDFPHFTQRKFLRLPIKKPKNEIEGRIIEAVGEKAGILQSLYQKMLSLDHSEDENGSIEVKRASLEEEIDNLVFKLYNLSDDDIEFIQKNIDNFFNNLTQILLKIIFFSFFH
ncbi:MAG: Eco57I restriction-modification methylase domain-containing protein, partial [Candidatus Hodarchaeales archaeon]